HSCLRAAEGGRYGSDSGTFTRRRFAPRAGRSACATQFPMLVRCGASRRRESFAFALHMPALTFDL
ncbi:MAG: hypothetical protein NDJ92_17685, partial [Thermoanaerobaculia bacterium]|nr:hypothetical protein [Thermoanaerobaculia bacterium]